MIFRSLIDAAPVGQEEQGFTLIELMVSMVVTMVILAGLYSNFIMQSRVQASQSSSVDAVEDLRIASQIMATQLKLASRVCWDSTNGLVYQPLGAAAMNGCAATTDSSWGAFRFSTGTAATGGTVCWDRPNDASGCQELLRGLDPTAGFQATPSNADLTAMRTITLMSRYKNQDRRNKPLSMTFDVLPRNN